MIEIKFIGRGGQGGKTAAYLAAEAAFVGGKQVQAFPEFGPEREGAPVFAFTRISDEHITIHSSVKHPDVVIIIDESLIHELPVTEGMDSEGTILINTSGISPHLRKHLGHIKNIYYVNASCISQDLLGRNMPNTPMLGALAKMSELFSIDVLKNAFAELFKKKLKPEILQKNLEAMDRAYKEVKKS